MQIDDRRQFWQREIFARFAGINIGLVVLAISLAIIGIVNIHSASAGTRTLAAIFHMGLGIGLMFGFASVPIRWLERLAVPLYLFGLFLLVMVALFGDVAKGARRWLDLGFIRFQPSEIMKIAVPMVVAFALHHLHEKKQWMQYPLSFVLLLLPFVLIAKQPDLGTAILVAASGFFVIFLAGLPWKWIGSGVIVAILSVPLYWQYGMKAYQKDRVMTLLDPTTDPLGKGYHTIQSMIAIGSGGILGKGYRQGTQSQLEFLPEPHTDFAFAVVAEEWGFLGFLSLLVLNILLIRQCLINTSLAYNQFTQTLCGALSFTYFIYLFINIGMVSGILPVVGVPLPFISYGGTSALITFAMMGIILACGKPMQEARLFNVYRPL